eukprot:Sspe_Gene.34046::Locus_16566_Transcript_1_1_Confidence_1.000_Length_1056::g.34046::m.34046
MLSEEGDGGAVPEEESPTTACASPPPLSDELWQVLAAHHITDYAASLSRAGLRSKGLLSLAKPGDLPGDIPRPVQEFLLSLPDISPRDFPSCSKGPLTQDLMGILTDNHLTDLAPALARSGLRSTAILALARPGDLPGDIPRPVQQLLLSCATSPCSGSPEPSAPPMCPCKEL